MAKIEGSRSRGNGRGSLTTSKSGVWVARWFDAHGRRVKRSTRTTNRRDAERMLAEWTREIGLVRAGVLDADDLRRRDELGRPLANHVRDYFDSFSTKPRTKTTLAVKRCVLRRLLQLFRDQLGREPMLRDFTPARLQRAMRDRTDDGLSARTANLLRQNAVALANWLTAESRCNLSDFSKRVGRFNEAEDRRKVRRSLTTDELARLLAVGESNGRGLWYSLAYWAGLRRGEIGRVTWGDVDFESGTLTIRNVKAGRRDPLPLRPELLDQLLAARPLLTPAALSTSRIFATPVHARTQRRDFELAGIAPVDADGRVADLHGLRTTLCTTLVRAGVAPTILQRAMRHADIRTTLKHYTRLQLADVATAFEALPAIVSPTLASATGTSDSVAVSHGSSGTSSGTSRRAKWRETTSSGERSSTASTSRDDSQSTTRQDDKGRFAKPREGVLDFPIRRAISSAG
jgi:integrase